VLLVLVLLVQVLLVQVLVLLVQVLLVLLLVQVLLVQVLLSLVLVLQEQGRAYSCSAVHSQNQSAFWALSCLRTSACQLRSDTPRKLLSPLGLWVAYHAFW
jgi:hypothetical protein